VALVTFLCIDGEGSSYPVILHNFAVNFWAPVDLCALCPATRIFVASIAVLGPVSAGVAFVTILLVGLDLTSHVVAVLLQAFDALGVGARIFGASISQLVLSSVGGALVTFTLVVSDLGVFLACDSAALVNLDALSPWARISWASNLVLRAIYVGSALVAFECHTPDVPCACGAALASDFAALDDLLAVVSAARVYVASFVTTTCVLSVVASDVAPVTSFCIGAGVFGP